MSTQNTCLCKSIFQHIGTVNTRACLTKGRVSLGNACNQRQDVTNEQHLYFHSISIKNKHFGKYIIVSPGSFKNAV